MFDVPCGCLTGVSMVFGWCLGGAILVCLERIFELWDFGGFACVYCLLFYLRFMVCCIITLLFRLNGCVYAL